MASFLLTYYLWIKALHIIAIIAWMAGMLYLPRLYVYHAEAPKGSDKSETFKVMERRLLRFIMNPAMIASLVFGVLMIWANPDLMKQGWMHAKLGLIVLMFGLHGVFSKWRKVFERDENTRSAKFYKIWNEAPTLLMIIIVIMAVAEPF
ncbi:protoporphyrinogen oxidase HemJ [Micavibrio aeruginosavorus]|uniref:Protoporphyrinogen IX oxidase n=1 Tax=Micavibrio aeruginosavorus EPB TaxID=349215 RepID=M4VFK8_9BACT|nr:protoporphyrinogen oxidase HemJ [Micavibrio aeruginosavorus]AGH96841.1 putative membrane protein [Micavibrio aeruginosavorus EPB]